MYSEVFAANASSWVVSPCRASVISAATVSGVCAVPCATTCSPTKMQSPSTRIRPPSLTRPKISVPTLSTSGMPAATITSGPRFG